MMGLDQHLLRRVWFLSLNEYMNVNYYYLITRVIVARR